ncbi:MAG: ribose-phosphate diphosphokinase [Nanoarchaeota archaeon]|nr:ribose-phosphate diphosphokinase [Nanoarchaeota archaeon]
MDKVIILADKMSNSWNFSEKIKDYLEKEKGFKIPLEEVEISHFRNGECGVHISENIRKKDIYFIHDSTKNPQEWWTQLLLLKDLLLSSSVNSISFVLPNLFYSRQDRKDKAHVPISSRALAESISSGLKRIITMDLHAPQIQGFYPANLPIDNLYSFPEAVSYLNKNHFSDLENLVVVSPDVGGADRAKAFLKRLKKTQLEEVKGQEYSFALINKTRLVAGEIEHMEAIGEVNEKNVLIVDDIIDSGETLCKAADLLKKKGAKKLFCYGTHGIFTKGTQEICEKFDTVMTSNTHYLKSGKVEVIDISSIFAEAIYRVQTGNSISELFE